MLAKYAKKFGLEDISTSDIEINAWIQRKSQADNALIDTRYKIAKVKQQVNYWKFLINILGWIFIVIGYIGVSLNLFGLIFFNPQVFEVWGPRQSCKNFGYPNVPYIINLGLDALSSATTLYLWVWWRKFSGVPTRTDTWSLWKKAIYIALIKSQILIVRYFSSIITIEYTVSQWEENFFKDEGVYILRNRSMGDTYIYSKPKTTTISQEYEKKVKQQAGKFFSSIVLTSFFMSYGYHF